MCTVLRLSGFHCSSPSVSHAPLSSFLTNEYGSHAVEPNDRLSPASCERLTFKRRARPYQLFDLRAHRNDDMERVRRRRVFYHRILIMGRLGGVINDFRRTKLGLEPLNVRSGPGIVDRLKVPWTYCFSPELVPKPSDWQNHIGKTSNQLMATIS